MAISGWLMGSSVRERNSIGSAAESRQRTATRLDMVSTNPILPSEAPASFA
jgi:hypothetical protein